MGIYESIQRSQPALEDIRSAVGSFMQRKRKEKQMERLRSILSSNGNGGGGVPSVDASTLLGMTDGERGSAGDGENDQLSIVNGQRETPPFVPPQGGNNRFSFLGKRLGKTIGEAAGAEIPVYPKKSIGTSGDVISPDMMGGAGTEAGVQGSAGAGENDQLSTINGQQSASAYGVFPLRSKMRGMEELRMDEIFDLAKEVYGDEPEKVLELMGRVSASKGAAERERRKAPGFERGATGDFVWDAGTQSYKKIGEKGGSTSLTKKPPAFERGTTGDWMWDDTQGKYVKIEGRQRPTVKEDWREKDAEERRATEERRRGEQRAESLQKQLDDIDDKIAVYENGLYGNEDYVEDGELNDAGKKMLAKFQSNFVKRRTRIENDLKKMSSSPSAEAGGKGEGFKVADIRSAYPDATKGKTDEEIIGAYKRQGIVIVK